MTVHVLTNKDVNTWRRRVQRYIKYPYIDRLSDAEIAEIGDEAMLRMEDRNEIMEVALVRSFERLKEVFNW